MKTRVLSRNIMSLSILPMLMAAGIDATASEPVLRHAFDIHAQCGDALDAGVTPMGKRIVIPITGGTVTGDISADILPGGADYQLIDTTSGRTEFNAIYTIMTHDGHAIGVTNIGVSTSGKQGDYFTTTPKFEAPVQSDYDWLNNRIFVCKPIGFEDHAVKLRVWVVE